MRLFRVSIAASLMVWVSGSTPVVAGGAITALDLHYKLFVGGARVAKLDLRAEIGDRDYLVVGSGATIGFIDKFADIEFSGTSAGTYEGDMVRPVKHEHLLVQRGKRKRHVVMTFDKKGQPKVTSEPKFRYGSKRAPIRAAHMLGTIDPTSTIVVPVRPGTSPLHPSQCQRAAGIFDGQQRYDVFFKHKASYGAYRLKAANYTGPAIRCSVRVRPVAGHYRAGFFPTLAKRKDIDIVMAPVADGRYLVPLRVRFPTPIGQAVFQAMRFNTQTTTRAAALGGN